MRMIKRFSNISTSWTLSGLALTACGGGGGGGLGGSSLSVTFDGDYIIGTSQPDVLIGTSRRDAIIDDAGHNTVHANEGNDYIVASGNVDGGDGHDFIFHNSINTNHEVHGGNGNDVIVAENGRIFGGSGNDYIQINADDNDRADFLGNTVQRISAANQSISKNDLFQRTPFAEVGNGITLANGGSGRDLIYVTADPGSGNNHDLRGGSGDDTIVTTHDALLTGGAGRDEFGIPTIFDDDFSDQIIITITDFQKGIDKLVMIIDLDDLPILPENLAELQSIATSFVSTMVNDDGVGAFNDNQINFTLRSQITNKEISYTIIARNIGQELTNEDFAFISFNDASNELNEIQ